MAEIDPTDPKTTAAIQQATQASDEYGKSLAGVRKETESLEKAASSFYKLITDEGKSLSEVTKLFYDNINAVTELRKNFGDLQGAADSTAEKISLMRGAMVEAETVLRDSVAKRIEYNSKLAETKKAIEELEAAKKETEGQLGEGLAKEIQKRKELLDIADDVTKSDDEKATALKEYTELTKKLSDAAKTNQTLRLAMLEVDQEQLEAKQGELDSAVEQAAAMLPLLRYEKARNEAVDKTRDSMDSIVSKLTSGAERGNLFASAFLAMQKSVDGTKMGLSGLLTTLGEGLTQTLLDPEKAVNRVFNLINDKLIKSTLEFDATLAKVGQSTGGFRKEFEGVAMNMGGVSFVALSQYGVTLEKFGQAYGSLSKNIGGFNNMLDSQRKLLAENAASMNTLGMSADNYGKLVAKFMASIGKSAEGSRDMINTLAKDAIALGKSVGEYTSQFETAMSRISGYGREAISIFKELEAVSAATKGVVSSQDLLSISDKFKDFDSAADAVSKLNAMLGGTSVNILDMMKADPAEQIMMIKRAAGEAGLEFDKLNVGYKRLLAEYFGGDINKAQAFFNANIAEAQSYLNKSVESEEELAKRKEQNIAFQEKLNALLDNMKVGLMPVIDALNKVVGFMGKILSFPGGPLIGTLGMITGTFLLMRAAIDGVTARIVAKVQAITGSAAASTEAAVVAETAATKEMTWIQRLQAAYRSLIATKMEAAGAGGGGGLPGSGAPPTGKMPKGGSGMAGALGGMALVMGLGFGLSQWSQYLQTSREKEIKTLESQLKIDELRAEKELFGSTINTNQTIRDGIVDAKGAVTSIDVNDRVVKLPSGAVMIGKAGGPVEKSLDSSNTSFREAVAGSISGGTTASGMSPSQASDLPSKNAPSSNIEAGKQSPANVNVTSYLQIDGRNIALITQAIKDYELTKGV